MKSACLILLALILGAGCSHVAGNYPVPSQSASALPTEYESPMGHEGVLVWQESGRVHGFLTVWRDTAERADFFRQQAARSGVEAYREGATMYQSLSDQGLGEAIMFAFFGKNVSLPCDTGDFQITFDDGTVIRDRAILRVEPRDVAKPYRWTRDSRVVLDDEPVGRRKALQVVIFLPLEHLDKQITKVAYKRGA